MFYAKRLNIFLFILFIFCTQLSATETMYGFTSHYLSYYIYPNSHWSVSQTHPSKLVIDKNSLVEFHHHKLGILQLKGEYQSRNHFYGMFAYTLRGGQGLEGYFKSYKISEKYSQLGIAEWSKFSGGERQNSESYWGLAIFGEHPTTDLEWQNVNQLTPIRIYEGEVVGKYFATGSNHEIQGLITIELDAAQDVAIYFINFTGFTEVILETKNASIVMDQVSQEDFENADLKTQFYGENAEEIGGAIQITHQDGKRFVGVFALKLRS